MLEKYSVYSAKFSTTNSQRDWFTKLEKIVSVSDVALLCGCSSRTVRDWKRAKFSPRYDCVEKVCVTHRIPLPKVQKISRLKHLKRAGKKGGDATIAKYGKPLVNEAQRNEKWHEWWNTTGKQHHKLPNTPLEIKKPRKSEDFAEFIGIMMGDGSVSTYHIGITLNATDDDDYVRFVSKLIFRLFGLHPKIYARKNKNAVVITVARKLLVAYLHSLGLPIGNKIIQNLNVPVWIMRNQSYARACVRGLMDTDGSVFNHTYKSKGTTYTYKKLSFTSASPALLTSVHQILLQNKIQSNACGTNLRIGSAASVARYFTHIGSHNPKHLKRMRE